MRRVLDLIERRTGDLAGEAFYGFLRDRSVDPRERLAFAPAILHFVMTFADLYTHVLRTPQGAEPEDDLQALVDAHTREDDDHYRWYLADLATLGLDAPMSLSEAARQLFGDATIETRRLSYEMCRMGLGASSLERLVLVLCIEAAGRVSLGASAIAARDLETRTGKRLVYFGSHHVETEDNHLLWTEDVERDLRSQELPDERAAALSALVDRSFDLFARFAREIHAFGASTRGRPEGTE